MSKRNSDLEVYAVVDPHVALVNALPGPGRLVPISLQRRDRNLETARREAQWPTWQMDRSRPDRSAARTTIERVSVSAVRHASLPWTLGAAGFVALGVLAAGLLAVGIERGLL